MSTQKVISRQIEFTAWRFTGNVDDMPDWVRSSVLHKSAVSLTVLTPAGEWLAPSGSWLLRNSEGKVAVCSAAEFAQRYQALSDDIGAVQLAMQTTMFQPGHWNSDMVERAAVAYHNAFVSDQPGWEPWGTTSEPLKAATRLAMRKALTAAISLGKQGGLP